jgi:iron complex transport system permease protein
MAPNLKTWTTITGVLVFLLAFGVLVSLAVGSVEIPVATLVGLLSGAHEGSSEHAILFSVRLPRVVLGVAVGGALSVAGVLLQGMFRNPLVEPYTLGISGGAALAVSLAIVAGGTRTLGAVSMPLSGFLGAVIVVLAVYALARTPGGLRASRLLLIGVMISFIASSMIMLVMALSGVDDLRSILFWIMGSLEEPNTTLIGLVAAVSLTGAIVSFLFAVDLNILSLGEEEAFHLGIHVERLKTILFVLASLLTGCCVSVAGVIGFVGLVVPHIMRTVVGGDHRILLVTSYISGALFLVLCDTMARVVVAPLELPVGVITGLVGGTIFIYVLCRRGVVL